MGYLKDFREDVTRRLEALDTQCRADVQEFLNVIANAVLESYRNGEKRGRAAAAEAREGQGAGPEKKRAWKKKSAH
jgi:hypothetical protein